MTEQERIEATEAALRAACVEAREQGLVLVRGAYTVPMAGVAVGCCAWGARDLTGGREQPDLGVEPPEYEAIERGWDGDSVTAEVYDLPMPWYDLGARLAAEFGPVPASTLEAG
jgi:hypothetical protein